MDRVHAWPHRPCDHKDLQLYTKVVNLHCRATCKEVRRAGMTSRPSSTGRREGAEAATKEHRTSRRRASGEKGLRAQGWRDSEPASRPSEGPGGGGGAITKGGHVSAREPFKYVAGAAEERGNEAGNANASRELRGERSREPGRPGTWARRAWERRSSEGTAGGLGPVI